MYYRITIVKGKPEMNQKAYDLLNENKGKLEALDGVQHIRIFESDEKWMGGGDLRYITQKTGSTSDGMSSLLPDDEVAPNLTYDKQITQRFDKCFNEINRLALINPIAGLAAHREIFLEIAACLRKDAPFDAEAFQSKLEKVLSLLRICSAKTGEISP